MTENTGMVEYSRKPSAKSVKQMAYVSISIPGGGTREVRQQKKNPTHGNKIERFNTEVEN